MTDEQRNAYCILQNQIEIMSALSLLLRYAVPSLVGKSGELDMQRDDLLQRHKDTMRVIALTNGTCGPHSSGVENGS